MNLTARNHPALRLALLPVLFGLLALTSCADGTGRADTDAETVTVKLRTGARAGEESTDPLVRDGDDRFTDLAVYVFDESDRFLALYKFTTDEAVNSYTTQAFSCGPHARSLLVIGNYTACPDLEAKLAKGLTKAQVRGVTAEGAPSAGRIVMVGETTLPAFQKGPNTDEHLTVDVTLKRLAARIDLFVFKEEGWNADVEIVKAAFANGVKNTTLENEQGKVSLPSAPSYDTPREVSFATGTGLLQEYDAEMANGLWNTPAYLRGRFYSYRSSLPRTSDRAARLDVTVLINGTIETTYSAVAADAAETGGVTLDAGKVYRVRAVLSKNGLVILTSVADWDDADRYDLEFAYPNYHNPLTLADGSVPAAEPTVYHNPNPDSEEGSLSVYFTLNGPAGQRCTPTLLGNPSDFEIAVFKSGTAVPDNVCTPSKEPYQIRIRALNPLGGTEKRASLAIGYTPTWDPDGTSMLLINGTKNDTKWPGSDLPELITVKQIETPNP